MRDINIVATNVEKLIDRGAQESVIEQYLGEEGYTRETFKSALPSVRSDVEEAVRKADKFAQGFNEAAYRAIGAVPDLMLDGLRAAGMTKAPKGFYTDALRSGARAFSAVPAKALKDLFGYDVARITGGEETTADKVARGVGSGVVDAASVMLPAAAVARGAQAGGLTKSVAGALTQQPVMQAAAGAAAGGTTAATDNPLLGLLAGLTIPFAAQVGARVVSPTPSKLTKRQQDTAKMAQAMGIELTPAQLTDSTPLKTAESTFLELPLTAGAQEKTFGDQIQTLTRRALSKAGIASDNISPEIINDAASNIGSRFDKFARNATIRLDDELQAALGEAVLDSRRYLSGTNQTPFGANLNDIQEMFDKAKFAADGVAQIEGKLFNAVSSNLKRSARRAGANNPDLRDALNDLSAVLDDAMMRSVSPDQASDLLEARRQYRNLLILEDSIAGGTAAARDAGDLSIGALKNAVKSRNKKDLTRARGDFSDVIRVGEFLAPRIPNSGTAQRQNMMNMLTLAGSGASGGLGYALADPLSAVGAFAAPYLAPRAAQALYNTPAARAYFTNTAIPYAGASAVAPAVALQGLLGATRPGGRPQ